MESIRPLRSLPPKISEVGTKYVRQLPFVVPMNSLGDGPPPREDGVLPTMAFQRVFISKCRSLYSLGTLVTHAHALLKPIRRGAS